MHRVTSHALLTIVLLILLEFGVFFLINSLQKIRTLMRVLLVLHVTTSQSELRLQYSPTHICIVN